MTTMMLLAPLLSCGVTPGHAQNAPPAPNMPDPKTTVPERIDPPLHQDTTGTTTGRTLSDQLNRSDGVIKPPTNTTPDMRVPAPVPNPGTTPVIPPPGTPGNQPDLDPK